MVLGCLVMTEGSLQNGALLGVYIDLLKPRDTQHACKEARDGESVWTKLSFLGQLFLVSFIFVIAWGIRTINQSVGS